MMADIIFCIGIAFCPFEKKYPEFGRKKHRCLYQLKGINGIKYVQNGQTI